MAQKNKSNRAYVSCTAQKFQCKCCQRMHVRINAFALIRKTYVPFKITFISKKGN